jgi:hypothetical protein
MSKTKNWLMDMEEEFYITADTVIGECETVAEFTEKMDAHKDKFMWTLDDENDFGFLCSEMWAEKWSKYA